MRHIGRSIKILKTFFVVVLAAVAATAIIAATPVAHAAEKSAPAKKASAPSSKKSGVAFNFVNVDITKVAEFISDLTGKNFMFDERIKGNITIISPSKLKPTEAYNLFTSVLQLKGYALVPSGVNAFKIVPAAEVKQSGLDVSMKRRPVNEDYIVRLVQLENISSDGALGFLQPLISKNGYVSSFGPGNMLLVIDSGLNIKKLLKIVSTIDQPSHHEEPEVVYLKNSSAESMVAMLNQGGNAPTVRRKGAAPTTKAAKAVADKRLNAVVLFGSMANKEAMKRLINMLDIPSKEEQGSINVYFLENSDSEEMATVLTGLVGKAKTASGAVKGRPGTPTVGKAAGISPFQAASGLSITPDKATNALVIVGSPSDYASLINIIKQLDRRRKQVYVEAMIVEASLDNLKELGSKWRGGASYSGDPVVIGGFGTMDPTSMQNIISGLSGMSVGGMSNYMDVDVVAYDSTGMPTTKTLSIPGFAALFSMSEFEGVVNVLSSPQILTADNTEAEIVVGENVPFVTKTETSASTNPIKSIERKDVGISLKLTPQITEGDYVNLDIYQEISSVKESSETIVTEVGPTTTKRSTKTTIIVKDKQTVVISGLMQERTIKGETRVPLLHRIPLLGWLFKYRTETKEKTNLLVFITPHIVRDAGELGELTATKAEAYARVEQTYREDQLLVKFKEGVSDQVAVEIIADMKCGLLKKLADGLFFIRLHRDLNVEDAIDDFMDYSEVEYAEPNFRMKALEGIDNVKGSSADVLSAPRKIVSEPTAPVTPVSVRSVSEPLALDSIAPDASASEQTPSEQTLSESATPETPEPEISEGEEDGIVETEMEPTEQDDNFSDGAQEDVTSGVDTPADEAGELEAAPQDWQAVSPDAPADDTQ